MSEEEAHARTHNRTHIRRVALVYLDRPTARGARARIASWRRLLAEAGIDIVEIAIAPRVSAMASRSGLRKFGLVFRGKMMPEALWWKTEEFQRVNAAEPDGIVCVTARLWDKDIVTRLDVPFVIDLVDRLSVSYHDRSTQIRNPFLVASYRTLAYLTQRVERYIAASSAQRVTAGWSERISLNAAWLPNVLPEQSNSDTKNGDTKSRTADYDLLFFGSLGYAPNVGAIRALARMWPEIQRRRAGTTLLIAGASAPVSVRRLAKDHNWGLVENFPDLESICNRARIAIAPLPFASGIQNKVLEAAAMGLPQVVTPPAVNGLKPPFPARVATLKDFPEATVALLEDRDQQQLLASAAKQEVETFYTPSAWQDVVLNLFSNHPEK